MRTYYRKIEVNTGLTLIFTSTPIFIHYHLFSIKDGRLSVDLMDDRTIPSPLAWYPRLAAGTPAQRENWELCGAGMGIHWPDLDEDLSTEGLLMGAKGITRTPSLP